MKQTSPWVNLVAVSVVAVTNACGSSIEAGDDSTGLGNVVVGAELPGPATNGGASGSNTPAVGTGVGDSSGTFDGVDTSSPGDVAIDNTTACSQLSVVPDEVVRQVPREVITQLEIDVKAPVAIYLVLDNSGSMDDPAGGNAGGLSKWDVAVGAITDFVNDPASDGIDVAIQYFHPIGVGNNPDECTGASHATTAVPIGPLPANASLVVDSLASTGPDGDTPTVGALTGGTDFCAAFQAQNPDEQCVTVLVTDGQPNGCGLNSQCPAGMQGNNCVDPTSAAVLTPIAATGLANGVTTFTIAMAGVTPEGFALLDAVATAGGSDCTPGAVGAETCDVSTTGAQGFSDALNTIRDTVTVTSTMTMTVTDTVIEPVVLPCEFEVPPPSGGAVIDPERVIVTLDLNAAGEQAIDKAADQASCAGEGWYFSDPNNLMLISACPATCDRITTATSASVQVLLGCRPDEIQ